MRASTKAGIKYEEKVGHALKMFCRGRGIPFESLREQVPRFGGFVDYQLSPAILPTFLIEVKSQWSLDAYNQLLRYAGSELPLVSRVCICKVYHPHVPIPEPATCLRLADLLTAKRGSLTIIPWSGRNT